MGVTGRIALLKHRCRILLITLSIALLPQAQRAAHAASARLGSDQEICDPLADYYLGMEDYPEAIRRHLLVTREHPQNALAYYHLGFAYGVVGDHQRELADYQKAVELGLSDWQLFLNMGLLYVETGHLDSACEVLKLATLLGPYRPETHFNLGLLEEQLGIYRKAEQEMLLSLRLDPSQDDARNTLGVIYAEEGNYERAYREWADLAKSNPDYGPARANLAILNRIERGEINATPRLGNGFAKAH
jgi:tetratricopeptide (TPR) repeat protein